MKRDIGPRPRPWVSQSLNGPNIGTRVDAIRQAGGWPAPQRPQPRPQPFVVQPRGGGGTPFVPSRSSAHTPRATPPEEPPPSPDELQKTIQQSGAYSPPGEAPTAVAGSATPDDHEIDI
jgi:hypothetical protein